MNDCERASRRREVLDAAFLRYCMVSRLVCNVSRIFNLNLRRPEQNVPWPSQPQVSIDESVFNGAQRLLGRCTGGHILERHDRFLAISANPATYPRRQMPMPGALIVERLEIHKGEIAVAI